MALGKLKDPCSVNPLIEALAGDRSVAKYAASALNGLGAVKAVPTLVERVVEGDHDIIFWASDLLSESDDERLLEPLVKQVVKDKAVSVLYVLREVLMRSATRATVQTLRAVAEIPDLFVRRQVHYGLIGRVGGSVRGAYGSEEDWIDCSDIRKQAEDELARRASKQT
jgi:HEAT repeat protein